MKESFGELIAILSVNSFLSSNHTRFLFQIPSPELLQFHRQSIELCDPWGILLMIFSDNEGAISEGWARSLVWFWILQIYLPKSVDWIHYRVCSTFALHIAFQKETPPQLFTFKHLGKKSPREVPFLSWSIGWSPEWMAVSSPGWPKVLLNTMFRVRYGEQ